MEFVYNYLVSGTANVDLDWIIDKMKDDTSGKPDIENFDDAYWDYIELFWYEGEEDVADEIQDDVREEIMRRIEEEEDDGKEA